MDTQKQNTPPQPNNPSQEKKLWRADVPEMPENEDQQTDSKQPGTKQNVRSEQQQDQNYLTKEDLPDASNESKGKMGSGQRQDSN